VAALLVVIAAGILAVLIPAALANTTTGWSTPVYLSTNASGETADVPAVALSNGAGVGNLAATWLNTVDGPGAITTTSLDSTFDDPGASGFSTPSSAGFADSMGALNVDTQQVAEDGQGDAIAVWIENAADNGQNNGASDGAITSAYEPKGTDAFGTATTVQAGVSNDKNSEPHVAFDADGDAVAVWAQLDGSLGPGGTWSVEYAIAPAGSGGTFGAPQTLVSGLASDPQPDLAIGQSGSPAAGGDNSAVVYVVPGSGLWVSQTYLGGATSLSAPTNAYATGDTLAQPVVALNSDADAAIAWVDNGEVDEDLLTGLRSSFVVPPDYIQAGSNQSDPQIAEDTTGSNDDETAVAFYDASTSDVVAALQSGSEAATGNGWEAAGITPTTEATAVTQQPQLAIPANGAVTLLWETGSAVEAMTSTAAAAGSDVPVFSSPPTQLSAAGVTLPTCNDETCAALASDIGGDDLAAAWLQEDSSSNVQVAASCYYQITGSTGFNADTCAPAKTSQTINFPPPGGGTVGGSEPLTATAGSGDPVVFTVDASSSPSDACSVSGTNGATVTFAHAGSCVIDANQAGNGTYSAAPQSQQTITVGKASQSIGFTAPGGGTVGGTELLSATGGGSGNPVVFSIDPSSSPADACSVSGATVTFVNAGTCVIDANQAGNSDYTAAAPVSHSVAVSSVAPTTTNTPAAATPTTTTVPPPVLGQSSDVAKTSGTVQVELPGTHTFVTVSASEQIPFGAVINATNGKVTATIALPGGGTSTATFWAGEFTLSQSSSGALTAKLVDGSSAGCPASEKASKHSSRLRTGHDLTLAKVTKKKPGAVVGSLWTNAKGSYTTSGKNGSAAVLGTEWLTRDQCDGTFFEVVKTSNDPHGEIRVTVLHPHRHTVLLKRGHSLLAPAPGFP
jgi:hypothetical protein